MKPGVLAIFAVGLGACGAAPLSPSSASSPPPPATGGGSAQIAKPEVELRDPGTKGGAMVGTQSVPMDGVAEGLAWPALRAAMNRKPGDHSPLTIAVAREVPLSTVLRAVWTLRDAELRLLTPDAAGTLHVLPLHPRPETSSAGCHLAVFVAANGDLRVAYPGGPRSIAGPDAAGALAQALAVERTRCAIRYVAFGAESVDAAWSSVFDVAQIVDRDKAAGDARYVLGEPVRSASAE
jgi:hypothetical protein